MRLTVQNASGAEMPPFGLCRLKSTLGHTGLQSELPYFEGVKPDGIGGIYCVNGPTPLPNGRRRSMRMWEDAGAVALNPAETVKFGDIVGPLSGQWYASVKGGGFTVMRAKAANNVVAVLFQRRTLRRQVMLKEDLFAAVDCQTDPSFAQAYAMREKANGDLETTEIELTIMNRFQNISIDAETYATAEWDGHWRLYSADCAADDSFSDGDVVSD